MANRRLFIVQGKGNDSSGLVGKITHAIAGINGNIVDLRQDVIHGLFTIFIVVDLSQSELHIDEFKKVLRDVSKETDIELIVDKYSPIPRSPDKKNLLLILVGQDAPGIIASISETLAKYKINIEFSQMIAREGIFLMELLNDISHCTLPYKNLKTLLQEKMQEKGISTTFQEHDVFTSKKRIILFEVKSSFIAKNQLDEIIHQTGIMRDEISEIYTWDKEIQSLQSAGLLLENLPVAVINSIVESIKITEDTVELLTTLKIMGYKIVLVSSGFSFFTESIKSRLDIDYSYGFDIGINYDAKTLTGELITNKINPFEKDKIIHTLIELESIEKDDITVISDMNTSCATTPGIHLEFDMKLILDYFNQHVLSKDSLKGLLGSFGIPKIS